MRKNQPFISVLYPYTKGFLVMETFRAKIIPCFEFVLKKISRLDN